MIEGEETQASLMCLIEGSLTVSVDSVPQDSFKLVKEQSSGEAGQKADDSLSSSDDGDGKDDDNDSVFSKEDKESGQWYLEDLKRNGRLVKVGTKVKL